jgi:hypothetical protein
MSVVHRKSAVGGGMPSAAQAFRSTPMVKVELWQMRTSDPAHWLIQAATFRHGGAVSCTVCSPTCTTYAAFPLARSRLTVDAEGTVRSR